MGFFVCTLSFLFAHACVHICLHMQHACVYGRFNALCVSVGQVFHVEHNEIRPTPRSLLSGLYLSSRLAQVISFLWRLVRRGSAQSTMSCRWGEESTDRDWQEDEQKFWNSRVPDSLCTSAHFWTKIWFILWSFGDFWTPYVEKHRVCFQQLFSLLGEELIWQIWREKDFF